MEFDLAEYIPKDARVLAGRDRGELTRHKAGLDDLDRASGPVEVRIPTTLWSLNSSFFLGLFSDSIKSLGEEQFRNHYVFRGKDITRQIENGIRIALLEKGPLADQS